MKRYTKRQLQSFLGMVQATAPAHFEHYEPTSGTIEIGHDPAHGPGSASSAPAEDGDAGPLYGPHKPPGHEGGTSGAT